MTTPDLLLAVDGSGTRTQALLADLKGKVLARGLAPSCDVHIVGFDKSCRALATAIEAVLQQVRGPGVVTGLLSSRTGRIAAACFGLAGVDSAEDEHDISSWIRAQSIAPIFTVVNDSELVMAAGTPDGWGIALISGTGSVCLGRAPGGKSIRVGGWGHLLGDEGSGYAIGAHALRLATQTADGRADAKGVLKLVLQHWSLAGPDALIRRVYIPGLSPNEIAELAPAMLELANKGDPAATTVLNGAAQDLAEHVEVACTKLSLTRPPLALSGVLLRANLRHALLSLLKSKIELGPIGYVADQPLGAITLARRLLEKKAS